MPLDDQSALSDEALLAAFVAGDGAAARVLTLRHTPRVLAQAWRLLGDRAEAEDVAQEAMLRMWKMAPDWRADEARLSTWLYRVTANLCTDRLRRQKFQGPALDEVAEPPDPSPGAEQRLQNDARHRVLRNALATLPERQRQAVVLRHLEGLDNPGIAEIMDITPRAVESLTARGKRALGALLRDRKKDLGYDE